jgi:aryl-alcohol dehydrogenase-like predicted oxidoreductase
MNFPDPPRACVTRLHSLKDHPMRYKTLGNTGLLVSEICLGTMTFGSGEGMWSHIAGLDQQAADRIAARAFDGGVNFVDTADMYSEGRSEEITGKAMKNSGRARTDIVLATKVFNPIGNKGPNDRGASRGHVMDAVKASLKRLGTDYIDLYQIHGIDTVTPMEEIIRAFDDLMRQGHIRYFGVSNWPAWMTMKALGVADRLNVQRLCSLQSYYTIASRDLERDIAPMLLSEKVGLMVWSPLAGGLLSGKFDREGSGPQGARRASFDFPPVNRERLFDCVDVLREIAKVHKASVASVAIAWILQKPFVTSVIVGAKNSEQLDDNLAATEVKLTADDLAKLDKVSALPPEYPGWMIERLGANRLPQP